MAFLSNFSQRESEQLKFEVRLFFVRLYHSFIFTQYLDMIMAFSDQFQLRDHVRVVLAETMFVADAR